ncbi:MAG: hypothetical protein HGA45_25325, partial [Chloroflexales bacterium]|nr:hypothetical protein [Chloroflexales bacterium]
SALTAARRETVPAAGLPARPELAVETRGQATYMLAYRLPAADAPATPMPMLQELIDPISGAPLDPADLRLGQLVGLRVTVVVTRPLLRADLEVALPAGLEPVNLTARAPFEHAAPAPKQPLVRIGGADLEPGVFTQLVVARAIAMGRFTAPPARLVAPYEATAVAITPAGLSVTISE